MTIAFIFVVQFGPQSRGCRMRGKNQTFVAKVYGSVISEDAFRWAWIISRASSIPRDQSKALRLKTAVLNGLIERELLAQAAENIGIKVSEDEVDENIINGTIYYNSSIHSPLQMPGGAIPIDFTRDDGTFDYDTFKMFVNGQFQMTIADFKNQQIREILADKMRKIIENGAWVSPAEVREEYDRTSNWIKIQSATFDPSAFIDKINPSPKDVTKWAENKINLIEEYYKNNQYRYTNVEKQVKIRNILLKFKPEATEEDKEKTRIKAEDLLKRIYSGEDFSSIAKNFSDDEKTKWMGGENPYSGKGTFDEKIEDIAFGMKVGEVKGPIETEDGYQIIKCEGFREGNIPFEEVKEEISIELFKNEVAKNIIKSIAEKFLTEAESGSSFEEAFEKIKQSNILETLAKQKNPSFFNSDLNSLLEKTIKLNTSEQIFAFSSHIPGIGNSKELINELFNTATSGSLIRRVIELNNRLHVIKLLERHKGGDSEFLKQKDEIQRKLTAEKRAVILEQWIENARQKAEKEGAIQIAKGLFQTTSEETKESSDISD